MSEQVGFIKGVSLNLCPNCFTGKVFKGLLTLNKRCPHCDFIFLKEEGYYLGSMIGAYFLSAFLVIPVFVIGAFFFHLPVATLVLIGSVEVLVLSPLFYRLATLIWLWAETKFDQVDRR